MGSGNSKDHVSPKRKEYPDYRPVKKYQVHKLYYSATNKNRWLKFGEWSLLQLQRFRLSSEGWTMLPESSSQPLLAPLPYHAT